MNKAQKELLIFINTNSRIPSIDEAVDIYTKFSLKYDGICIFTNFGCKCIEYSYSELKSKTILWLKYTIGSLILQKKLNIEFKEK